MAYIAAASPHPPATGAVKAPSDFSPSRTALKYLYLATRSLTHRNRQDKAGDETDRAERLFAITFQRPVPGRRDGLTMTAGNTARETGSRAVITGC